MIATYTEPRKTPFTFDRAAEAMRAALTDALKTRPRDEVLALALAKSALETGRWQSCWNGNWGNIKASSTYIGQYTCILLNEVLGGKVIWFKPEGQLTGGPNSALVGAPMQVPPGHPQTRMRAYANIFDGAFAYVDFVSGIKRYLKAWQALLAGNPTAYVHELKLAGYFTADEATYAKAVVSLHKEFLLKLEGKSPPETPAEDTDWDKLKLAVATQQIDHVGAVRAEAMAEIAGIPTQQPTDPEDVA